MKPSVKGVASMKLSVSRKLGVSLDWGALGCVGIEARADVTRRGATGLGGRMKYKLHSAEARHGKDNSILIPSSPPSSVGPPGLAMCGLGCTLREGIIIQRLVSPSARARLAQ